MKKISALVLALVLLVVCMPLMLGVADTLPEVRSTYAANDAANSPRNGVVLKYGDLNNDGKINVRDLGLLQQSLNGWDVEINASAADLNNDGKVNIRDLGMLQQYLNGWDVKLPDAPSTPTEPTTPPTEPTTPPTEPTTPPTEPTTPPTEPTTPPEPETYTVVFKDYDGSVLKSVTVNCGESAAAPADPVRPGYTFTGWDKDFSNITADLVVKATYVAIPVSTDATIYLESVTVNKGTNEVQMNVRVRNNPGIMTATLTVNVDDAVLGFKSATKTGYDNLFLTAPGSKQTASPYNFLLDGMELSDEDKVDGVLFTITFTIKDKTATGTYAVDLSYAEGDITNENYEWLNIAVEDGTITIK